MDDDESIYAYINQHVSNKPAEKRNKELKNNQIPRGLKITKLPNIGTNFPQRPAMKSKIIPDMASSTVIIGSTGSGKTNLLIDMFINPNMYRGYFDEIWLFSKTGHCDSLFEYLELKDDRVIVNNMEKKLKDLIDKCEKESKSIGVTKMKRRALLFEDLTANAKLMRSPAFLKCFCQNRHMACMVFACVHSYTRLTRTCRQTCTNIFLFPMPLTDIKLLSDDHCPPNMSKKDFINDIINVAHKRDIVINEKGEKEENRPFLHINCKVDFDTRYRKSFDYILKICNPLYSEKNEL